VSYISLIDIDGVSMYFFKQTNFIILFLLRQQFALYICVMCVVYTLTSYHNNGSEMTEILHGAENVMKAILQFLSKSNKIDSCADYKGPSVAIEVQEYKKLLFDLRTRRIKLRYVTDITKENVHYCKELMEFEYEIRHLDGIKANFSVSETEYMATATLQEAKPVPQVIYSNVKDFIEQQKFVFESFWNKAIPAKQRIREIEGVNLGTTEIIQDSFRTKEVFIDIIRSAADEILLILPTVNAFLREERIGIIQLLREAAEEHNIQVRVLTPVNDIIEKTLQKLEQKKEEKKDNIEVRRIELESEIQSTIVVTDRKASLITELKDDLKEDIVEAIGLSTYSTSKPTVLSYVSIFEKFWKQIELYEQLKVQDKMQKEFINIASHEMKTPTQAIIGYSDLLQRHPEKKEQMIQAISRNAIRLQRLTNDILDVTRIESQSLNLNKEQFNLNELITSVVEDYRSQIEKENGNVKLLYNKPKRDDFLIVEADRERIIQAISNLLSNAIKFTPREGGIVSITVKEKKNHNDINSQQVIVSVTDNGEGIHPEIFPRLFSKFATKSSKGTGLGLFITKSIIEAHGGTIYAENILDGERGATFTFSLPLSKKQQQQQQKEQHSNMEQISSHQK
jgi:two-component system, OmpR family, sensor histidine kinase VicK